MSYIQQPYPCTQMTIGNKVGHAHASKVVENSEEKILSLQVLGKLLEAPLLLHCCLMNWFKQESLHRFKRSFLFSTNGLL